MLKILLNIPEKEGQWIADTLTHTLGGRACSKLLWLHEWLGWSCSDSGSHKRDQPQEKPPSSKLLILSTVHVLVYRSSHFQLFSWQSVALPVIPGW